MSVGNLSMAAFANEKYLGGTQSQDYGVRDAALNRFEDRPAEAATSVASYSTNTNTSMGAATAWRSRNPVHVQGLGAWNRKWSVSFDDPNTTPRPTIS